jgi:putative ABC transport system permease protein
VNTFLQNIRFALRTLRRSPAFGLAAVGTLAFGIAATTAIFSTANAVLLRPLPYPHWQDLHTLRTTLTTGSMTSGLVAPVELSRLQNSNPAIEAAALTGRFEGTLLLDDNTPVAVLSQYVSEGFFQLFGRPHSLGAGFTPEHHRDLAASAVILSYRLWREAFGSDPAIVGKTVRFAEQSFPIVGVAAHDMDIPQGTDVWVSMPLNPQSTAHMYEGYLRARPGTSPETLRSSLDRVAKGLERDFPGPQTNRVFVAQPLLRTIVGDLRPILVIVLSATGLLLLLACANVTNLLLVRSAQRKNELALRAALGASRRRLVGQLLTESMVIASAGAVTGVVVAYGTVQALLSYGASTLPRLQDVPFDGSVLLFAGLVLVTTTALIGAAPALHLAGERVQSPGGRSIRGNRATRRTFGALIVAEVAVAVTLVAGAGWLVRSFMNLQGGDPGFVASGRLVFDLSLPFERYKDPERRAVWTRTLLDNLRSIRGVSGVAMASGFPLQIDDDATPLVQLDSSSDRPVVARRRVVSPGFFEAMGMRVRAGRTLSNEDRRTSPPVAVVSDSFARRYLGDRDPTRAQISYGFPKVNPQTQRPIVGVVSDVKYASLWSEPEPTFYLVAEQAGTLAEHFRVSVIVATSLPDPIVIADAVRAQVTKADPLLAFRVQEVESLVSSALNRQRLGMTLMLVFGGLALALAAIGIYGVIAYSSTQRRGEVATRMALGATPRTILRLLTARSGALAALGALIGIGAAWASGRIASTWLYEVQPSDPFVLVAALALVLAVTAVAILVPARAVARTSPADALHSE